MEARDDRDEQEGLIQPPKPSTWKRVTDVVMYAGDVAPVVGRVKMLAEGLRGETFGGFKLNDFERICYVSSVAFSGAGYYTWWLLAEGELKLTAYTTVWATSGFWLTMVSGKARQTGEILSLPMLWNKVSSGVTEKVASVRSRITQVLGE